MMRRPTGFLIGLNVALAGVLGAAWFSRPGAGAGAGLAGVLTGEAALAQGGAGAPSGPGAGAPPKVVPGAVLNPVPEGAARRARGQYLLLGGRMQGSPLSAVYVVDTVNHELLTLRWSRAEQKLELLSYRSISADMTARPGRGR